MHIAIHRPGDVPEIGAVKRYWMEPDPQVKGLYRVIFDCGPTGTVTLSIAGPRLSDLTGYLDAERMGYEE